MAISELFLNQQEEDRYRYLNVTDEEIKEIKESDSKNNPIQNIEGITSFYTTAYCPLCRYPLTVRMTRAGPKIPCQCKNRTIEFYNQTKRKV